MALPSHDIKIRVKEYCRTHTPERETNENRFDGPNRTPRAEMCGGLICDASEATDRPTGNGGNHRKKRETDAGKDSAECNKN